MSSWGASQCMAALMCEVQLIITLGKNNSQVYEHSNRLMTLTQMHGLNYLLNYSHNYRSTGLSLSVLKEVHPIASHLCAPSIWALMWL